MNRRNALVKTVRNLLSVCVLFLCAGSVALAQAGRGSISGLVSDPAGALVAGARVVLLNPATGVTQHTVTTGAGLYTFISLNPGVYQVTASQKGFKSVAHDNVAVTVDQITAVNITLEVGAITETVTVTGGTSLVEPSNSTVGQLIDSATIDRVPLVYRNVFDLVQLSAGVIPVNGSPNSSDSLANIQNISSGRPGVDVSADTINGSIVGSVYYMLDGSPIGIAENNSAAIIPAMNIPEDGVDEVRVETQNTPASYQSGAAGVISLVSKSGTNKFHGDVFGVFRPDALAANDYFNKQSELINGQSNTPPSFHRYQEGAAIGGPIKRGKIFFFADYEDTQQVEFEGIDAFTVPTSAERTGNFSAMGFSIYDPTQPDLACGTLGMCRQQFPGNTITNPNPIGLLFLSKMPHCNFPSPTTCDSATSDVLDNLQLPGLDPFDGHRFDVRVDWAKSERQRLFTRFSYDKLIFSTANVFPTSGWDPNYAQNTTNARNVILADDLTLNSTTVLNLRYSFTRHHENQGNPAFSNTDITNLGSVNGTMAGFPASLAAQEVFKQLPFMIFNDYTPPAGVDGVGGTANYNLFVYASENSDANATINKVWGKHELSTGFEWMKRYLNVGQPPAPAGVYGFDLTATDQQASALTPVGGSDFASILVGMGMSPGSESNLGYPGNFTKDIFPAESNPYYAAFVEDTYHYSKALTITAGLRWDIFGGRNERFNRQEYFNPTVGNTLNGVSYTGAEIYVNGSNRSPFTTNLHNFGPRLAFAWQPITHFVVRGGAGFYYGPSTHNVSNAVNTDGFSSGSPWNGTCFNPDGSGNSIFGLVSGSCPLPTPGVYNGDYSLSNPFPTAPGTPGGIIPVVTTPPTGLANNLGITLSTVLHSQRTPTIYNYNFALEYELPHEVVVTVGYVGSRGLFLPFSNVDLNQLSLETIQQFNNSLCVVTVATNPGCNEPNTGPVSLNPNFSGPVPLWATLQQFPQFGNGGYGSGNGILAWGYSAGDSEYDSLQAKVQKRLTSHFTTLSTFTWGKIMTDDGYPPLGFVGSHNAGGPQDWRDLRYEHSISPQDVKYAFTGQVSYDLPVGKGQRVNLNGVADKFAGGWTVNAITYLTTGVPIPSPSSGANPGYFNQRADLICNPASGIQRTPANWVNNNCFAIPGTENGGAGNPLIPGNAPAYLANVRTRGARELDLSVYKTIAIGEHKDLRFDVSLYNAANWAQYGMPPMQSLAVSGNQPFGGITTNVNTPRQFQFGARFTF
jgi:hypothetical protein